MSASAKQQNVQLYVVPGRRYNDWTQEDEESLKMLRAQKPIVVKDDVRISPGQVLLRYAKEFLGRNA